MANEPEIIKIENPDSRKNISELITDFEIDNPKTSKMDLIHFAQVVYAYGHTDGIDWLKQRQDKP